MHTGPLRVPARAWKGVWGLLLLGSALLGPWVALGQQIALPEALAAYRNGDCATAAPALERLLAQQPKNIRLWKLLADCQARAGRMEDAKRSYLAVLEVAPNDAEARRALESKPAAAPPQPVETPKPKAAAAAPPALRVDPETAERLQAGGDLLEAERLIEAGRLAEAEQKLVALIARQPRAVIARRRLAEICSGSERFHQAGGLYAALAEQTGEAELYLRAAQNYGWAAQYEAAIDLYRRYLNLDPASVQAHGGLANSLVWSGKPADAVEPYEKYLAAYPDDLDARLNYARALVAAERGEEAGRAVAMVRRRRGDNPELNLVLAQSLELLGNHEAAIEAYGEVLKANPKQGEALSALTRLKTQSEMQRAYRALQEKRFDEALQIFSAHSARNPEDDAALLQTARVSSWAERYAQAAKHYRSYLDRNPSDPDALRELARVELALPDFAAAQQRFKRLVDGPFGTTEDREGLVQSYLWAGRNEEALEAAERLLETEPANAVALEAASQARDHRRDALLEEARRLTAAGDYAAAIQAYQAFIAKYGSDRSIDLAVARVYAWDSRFPDARKAYEAYVARNPNDTAARIELARVREWSGEYEGAEQEYLALAQGTESENPDVLLGLAQVSAHRGDNRFEVVQKFRRVLEADPGNPVARARYEQLGPEVSPSVSFDSFNFGNSDDFGLSMNAIRGRLPFRGGLAVEPFYRYDYFKQARQIGGTSCGGPAASGAAEQALSESICASDGVASAHVGGLGLGFASNAVDFHAEVGAARFEDGLNTLQTRAQLFAKTGSGGRVGASYARRNAAYDVQTVAPAFAGILADTAMLSFEQPLSKRWGAALLGGLTRYSDSADGAFASNMQRFGGARLNYRVTDSFTAGYYLRMTGFREHSAAYFSPSSYGSAGGSWSWRKQVAESVGMGFDAELGYGRIDRRDIGTLGTLEVMFRPEVLWKVQPDLALRTSYRYGRGSNSAFRASAYQTNVLELRLESSFLDRMGPGGRRSGLVIR